MDQVIATLSLNTEDDSVGTSLELLLVMLHKVVKTLIIGCVVFSRFLRSRRDPYDDDNNTDVEKGDGQSDTSIATPALLKSSSWRSI